MTLLDRLLTSKFTILFVLIIHFSLWMFVFTFIDIHPEMADRWIWSRFPSLGYQDHPPLVAFSMWVISLFPGNPVIGLKIGSVLLSVVILSLSYWLGMELFERKTALAFVLILAAAPYFSIGSLSWNTDQPLMLFWLLSLLFTIKFIKTGSFNWLLPLGASIGLGLLTEYTMVLFIGSFLIWAVTNKRSRIILVQWQTYAASALVLLFFAPNLYWNIQNNWATFKSLLETVLANVEFFRYFPVFLFSQFILFSLIFTVYFWWLFFTKNISQKSSFGTSENSKEYWSLLIITGMIPFLLSVLISFFGKVPDPHGVNIAYFSFFLLLARYIVNDLKLGRLARQVSMFVTSSAITVALLAFAAIQVQFINLPVQLPGAAQFKDLSGWESTANQIESLCQQNQVELPEYVVSKEYPLSSSLGLYLKNNPLPYTTKKESRNSWSSISEISQKSALLVCIPDECEPFINKAERTFPSVIRYLGEVKTRQEGIVLRKLKVFYLPTYL